MESLQYVTWPCYLWRQAGRKPTRCDTITLPVEAGRWKVCKVRHSHITHGGRQVESPQDVTRSCYLWRQAGGKPSRCDMVTLPVEAGR